MTQLNENIKLGDIKTFFPKSRHVFHQFGLEDQKFEDVSLIRACEIYEINYGFLLAELLKLEKE